MEKVKHDLLTSKHTQVMHEDSDVMEFNAPHHFVVWSDRGEATKKILAQVDFQKGPILENGINGIHNEDLIAMVICRLEHFQQSEYASRDNAMAITKLEEALLWLRKRTIGREQRGVEGTSTV